MCEESLHALTLSRSHALTLSRSHALTLSHSHTLTLSRSHALTLSHSHTLTLSHRHRPTLSHSHTLTRSHSHALTLSRSHALTLSRSHTLTLSHRHRPTHKPRFLCMLHCLLHILQPTEFQSPRRVPALFEHLASTANKEVAQLQTVPVGLISVLALICRQASSHPDYPVKNASC